MIFQSLIRAGRKLHSQVREAVKEHSRSPKWASAREAHLKDHPCCAACGSQRGVQVHHAKPFHIHPELELDPTNFITLCMDTYECHLNIGHGDSFRCYNPDVREDAEKFGKLSESDKKSLLAEIKSRRLTT